MGDYLPDGSYSGWTNQKGEKVNMQGDSLEPKKNHNPTHEQEKAFKKVESAMKNAKKTGLRFYGKSDVLIAYTEEAANYQNIDFNACLSGDGSTIPYLSARNVLDDSGADDYACYLSLEHQEKYNIKND